MGLSEPQTAEALLLHFGGRFRSSSTCQGGGKTDKRLTWDKRWGTYT